MRHTVFKVKRSKRSRRLGTLIFFIPVVVVLALVVFAVVEAVFLNNGTLEVTAMSSGPYSSPVPLEAPASVNGVSMTTPFNLSLGQGSYTVTFGSLRWYNTPKPVSVTVPRGTIAYALGSYTPTVRHVALSGTTFNGTSTTALHGVTPVVWINTTGNDEVLESAQFSTRDILPGQSYAMVFPTSGTFTFYLLQGSTLFTVNVS